MYFLCFSSFFIANQSQWSHAGTPPPATPHQPCSKPCAARQGHGSPAPVPRLSGIRRAQPSATGTYTYPRSVRHKLSWRFPASSRRVMTGTMSSPAGRGPRPPCSTTGLSSDATMSRMVSLIASLSSISSTARRACRV